MSRYYNGNGRGRRDGNSRLPRENNGQQEPHVDQQAPNVVQPVFELTYPGGVRAAVWENEGKDGNLYYSITISRRYRDQKDGEWKSGTRFGPSELLAVGAAAQQAFIWCMENPLDKEAQGGE